MGDMEKRTGERSRRDESQMTDITKDERERALEDARGYRETLTWTGDLYTACKVFEAEAARADELERENERLTAIKDASVWAEIRAHDRRATAESDVATLTARIEELEAALRPFANLLPDNVEPADSLQRKLQEWSRAARAALTPTDGKTTDLVKVVREHFMGPDTDGKEE